MRQYWMTMINDKRALLKYILRNGDVVLNVIKDRIATLDAWKMHRSN
ncbi:hypothetical protein [Paucisalibacillus sp. EB02]|nr:hypothetical protein [Paucisalibacillus sp. EB02]